MASQSPAAVNCRWFTVLQLQKAGLPVPNQLLALHRLECHMPFALLHTIELHLHRIALASIEYSPSAAWLIIILIRFLRAK